MFSKAKFCLKIVLAETRVRELLGRKRKNFISVRIELAGGFRRILRKNYSETGLQNT